MGNGTVCGLEDCVANARTRHVRDVNNTTAGVERGWMAAATTSADVVTRGTDVGADERGGEIATPRIPSTR